eukprot:CAMPEP_0116833376 /NCGR_PEP_ID=MMETSP0418-20121206/6402_1 /TAXON_ID=1158023 /ORGANISM="Astrosyne radiata, Strain 13vi08-1A" /LENGTH=393 /DNA_ID=CAMNT_0004462819 /DNA_START=33 /DNA_END=1214 /DNA_ORIENTATION=-
MPVSLATSVAGIPMETCVYNASGPRTADSAALAKIFNSKSGAILTRSATLQAQEGCQETSTWHDPDTDGASLNSEKAPNSGIEYYISQKTYDEVQGGDDAKKKSLSKKPYIVSIQVSTMEDTLKMIKAVLQAGVPIDAIELNVGTSSTPDGPIVGHDFELLKTLLARFSANFPEFVLGFGRKVRFGLKLPPYFEMKKFEDLAEVLNTYRVLVRYVVSTNTLGNALAVDYISEAPCISLDGGFAGLSGRAIKYTALANIKKLREVLDPCIDVVGVGGVENGTDVFEMILCGASAVQVGTTHWKQGPKCFARICRELEGIMKKKGYESLADFKGKLKPWSKEGAAAARKARASMFLPQRIIGGSEIYGVFCAALVMAVAFLLAERYELIDTLQQA